METQITVASPIVAVMKKGGNVLICGDFRVTINKHLLRNDILLPKFEEISSKVVGGSAFSIIDLKDAYVQMEVDEDSRHLLVIETHLGYNRYTGLPFGVSVAPSLFQETMDTILHIIDGVA